jgi:diketogulonate reductase-like aldo/keto reductase
LTELIIKCANKILKYLLLKQIEVSPYLNNDELVEFCQKNGVIVSAYGPVGAGQQSTNRPDLPILLQNPLILNLAEKYNKTPGIIFDI